MTSCVIAPATGGKYPAAANNMAMTLNAMPPMALCSAMVRMRRPMWSSSSTRASELSRITAPAASDVISLACPKATPTVAAVVTLDPDPYPGAMAGIESAQPVRSLTLVGRRTRGYKVDVYREDSGLGIDRRGRRRVLRLGGLRLEWYPK